QSLLESFLKELGIRRNEAVFGAERASSPRHGKLGGREVCDLSQKFIAQRCRLVRTKHISDVALSAPQSSISGLSGRRRKSNLSRVELTAGCWPTGCYARGIKIILARYTDQREYCVPTRVG